MWGGMDFPDDITTNVSRVENIKEVHWAFYTGKPKDKSALQNPPSSEEEAGGEEEEAEEDLEHHLQLSEYILRDGGRHVLFDKDKGGLWVFVLSHALDEGNARTLSLDGLENTSFGSIRSGDLITTINSTVPAPPSTKIARFAHSTAKAIEELNTLAHGSNSIPRTQSSISEPSQRAREALNASQDHSVSEIYSQLISAVSWSLSHRMGKGQKWIQVGPYACIDARTLGDDIFDNLELHSWITTTTKLCFDVNWLSSGIMLISFFEVHLPRHIRLAQVLSSDGRSTGLAVGSPLLLEPTGIQCQYLGIEDVPKSDAQRKSREKWKASIQSRLAHQGIRLMPEVTWIQVYGEPASNVSSGMHTSLWPADLCLCEDLMGPVSGEDGEPLNLSIVDGSTDPLEEAESWFLGKSARVEALRAREQEESLGAQASKDVEDTDDEDALSPFGIPMDQGITPQDVSGIYPTPPDGLPPALRGSSNPSNPQFGDSDDEEKDLQPSDEARGDYDRQENDDLFGDMDIDMFASNGLTEADFSFFDEPGMLDEDLRETGQLMASGDANEMTDHGVAIDGQELTVTPTGRGDSGSDRNVIQDQENASGVQGSNQMLTTPHHTLPRKDFDRGPESAVEMDDVDYGVLEQVNPHHRASTHDARGNQRGSFQHVPFQIPTFDIDDKYNMQGRFAFDVDELPLPKHAYDRSRARNDLSKIGICPEESSVEENDEDEDTPGPDDSDLHDAMDLSSGSEAELSRKRKREQLDDNEHIVTPLSSVPLAESLACSPQNKIDEPMSGSLKPDILEQAKIMIGPESGNLARLKPSFAGQGQALIKVAQVVANQAVSGFLQSQTEFFDEGSLVGQSLLDQSLQSTMTNLLSAFFPTHKRCSLREYASLGEKNPAYVSREQVAFNQRSLKPAHIAGGLTGAQQLVFKLDSPYARVRRNGTSIEISASALPFWEELSLGPSHETKDIDAFCLCPRNKFIEEAAITFLNMIKGAYQSCNLGSHDIGASLADCGKRLVTVPMDPRKPDKFLQDIAATCEGLGTRLEELGLESGTTVIYIIDPFKDRQHLPGLCDALLNLPNSYGAALERRRPERQNNIVMQIVPLDLVWSPECIIVPSPADYRRLAFEIYSQCDASESGHTQDFNFMRAPAIRLAKAVPKTIDFKLASECSAPLIQSDNCVHMSYTWDTTSEWLAAVWTDNLGILSWHACYCLGKNEEKPWKPFYEVVKEMLETSFVMLHPPNAPWRLFVCKDSQMLKAESDVWLRAIADSSRPSISCTLLTVDVKPRLTFTKSDLQKSYPDLAPGPLATPGATPQTNTPSPDISGLGSTPAGNAAQVGTPPPNAGLGDPDSEARLVDITDETWGVLIDGTLDDLHSQSDRCVSMASGFLVKRAGSRDEDGLIPLGVNLVHGQKPLKALLKEVLGMYRNLATLARVRGVVNPVKNVLPLHIAAARKAWRVVSETMRYEPE